MAIKLKGNCTNKLYTEKLNSRFKDQPFIATKDITSFYREFEPDVKQTTINWRVYTLVKTGTLTRIGRGKFILGEARLFHPEISPKLGKLYKKLKNEFPYMDTCVWNTSIFNEFMIHQPSVFLNIIETEKESTQSLFYYLKELKYPVFIEPTSDILDKYLPMDKEAMIIKPLVSEAPVQQVNGVTSISIEKLLVDIFCDDVIFAPQQGAEMRNIFTEAFSKYTVNQSKMLRYANRRRKKEAFQEYMESVQIYGSK